ncbi:unnamed protein product [Lasius platythorax]|uniref:Uncharacterized protein n=1 Tax=Lasius platythorax TaxID=488582 RepID=A0AAV2N3Q1_9HYME
MSLLPRFSRTYGQYYRDKGRRFASPFGENIAGVFFGRDATNFRTTFHDARDRNGIGEKIARRSGDIGRTARSSSTAYARGGREQGVHLLETCSLYPLLIERSALGFTGVDWTHQQPLTVAPSRETLTSHPTLYT